MLEICQFEFFKFNLKWYKISHLEFNFVLLLKNAAFSKTAGKSLLKLDFPVLLRKAVLKMNSVDISV